MLHQAVTLDQLLLSKTALPCMPRFSHCTVPNSDLYRTRELFLQSLIWLTRAARLLFLLLDHSLAALVRLLVLFAVDSLFHFCLFFKLADLCLDALLVINLFLEAGNFLALILLCLKLTLSCDCSRLFDLLLDLSDALTLGCTSCSALARHQSAHS